MVYKVFITSTLPHFRWHLWMNTQVPPPQSYLWMNTQVLPPQSSQGNGAWPLGSRHLHDMEQSYLVELVWRTDVHMEAKRKKMFVARWPSWFKIHSFSFGWRRVWNTGLIRLKKRSLPSLGTVWPFGWRMRNGSTNDSMSFSPWTFRKSLSPASRKFENVFKRSVVLPSLSANNRFQNK